MMHIYFKAAQAACPGYQDDHARGVCTTMLISSAMKTMSKTPPREGLRQAMVPAIAERLTLIS